MRIAGRSVDEVVAARPTAPYDTRWGNGIVSAKTFIRDVYRAAR